VNLTETQDKDGVFVPSGWAMLKFLALFANMTFFTG
jgi:hypothetical protein